MRRKLADNYKRIRDRIADACGRCGRSPDRVRLVAVTKMVEVDVIRMALDAGMQDLGESRVQDLVKRAGMVHEYLSRKRKLEPTADKIEPRWHMIGHLQRNKVKAVLPWVDVVHSLDSLRLAEEISSEAQKIARTIPILIQVNVSGEKSKRGIAVGAAPHLAAHLRTMPGLSVRGLMTMAPLHAEQDEIRSVFRRLREIADDMRSDDVVGPEFTELSMGMSNDFEIAIEEGATMVRIGTALFEGVQEKIRIEN